MSSTRGMNSGRGRLGGGGTASSSIPVASRKVVQSLKEIVNCPDHEIYSMLKECDMDPNETINRLLSQDPFHEVKSKRDKKKENKDISDSRPRAIIGSSNRGINSKGSLDHNRGTSNLYNTFESGSTHVKPAYKKEDGQSSYSSSLPASGMTGYNSWQPPLVSEPASSEIRATGGGDSQPTSGVQSSWLGVPGQVSMADIVKKGKQPGNTAYTSDWSQQNVSDHHFVDLTPSASHYDHTTPIGSELNNESGVGNNIHASANDDWNLVEEPPSASAPPVTESHEDSVPYSDSSKYAIDGTQLDGFQVTEDGVADNFNLNRVTTASGSVLNMHSNNSGPDNDSYDIRNSYQPEKNTFVTPEDTSLAMSSAAENLQQLSLHDDELSVSEEDNLSVKIPNHLQVQSEHFSHLSFGSFGVSINSDIPAQVAFHSTQNGEPASAADTSVVNLDTRNYGYYEDEHLRTTPDGNISNRIAGAGSYEPPSVSHSEALKQDDTNVAQSNQYNFPSSASGYSFENTERPALAHPKSSSQIPNHLPFSDVYTNSLPNTLLTPNVHLVRPSDMVYSSFPMVQSLPEKFSNTMSSISAPTLSMQEALRGANFSSPTSNNVQSLPTSSVATLPHHLPVHPYSQHSLPLGPFANMISYPLLPQGYSYLPPAAFQQHPFPGHQQSLSAAAAAAAFPQYKNSVSGSALPQSASNYGDFGSNPSLNPPAAVPSMGYDDMINAHYKDGSPLIPVRQNENTGMWLQDAAGSRTVPYYNYPTQQQPQNAQQQHQISGFRQAQHAVYPNFYQSLLEQHQQHQQQQIRDAQHQGSPQTQQSKHLWHQNNTDY